MLELTADIELSYRGLLLGNKMVPDPAWRIVGKILETLSVVLPGAIGCAIVLLILSLFSSQACNPGKTWWRNPGLFTDACYFWSFLSLRLTCAWLL